MDECPFCGQHFGFDPEMLAEHLYQDHADANLADPRGRLAKTVIVGRRSIKCWCGEYYQMDPPGPMAPYNRFSGHLQRHGGALVHHLRQSLNLPDYVPLD